MTKKKIKAKKPTVESTLREKNEHLAKSVIEGNKRYADLNADHDALIGHLKVVYRFVKEATKTHETGEEKAFFYDNSYGMRNTGPFEEKASGKDLLNAITSMVLNLSKDFAREDEGTLLLQEHKGDLMQIIGTLTHDETRPSPKLERLAILAHNIEYSKKENRFLDMNDPSRYRN